MPGKLVHTNEVLVMLGDNWFVDRSAVQAAEIVARRMERKWRVQMKQLHTNHHPLLTTADVHSFATVPFDKRIQLSRKTSPSSRLKKRRSDPRAEWPQDCLEDKKYIWDNINIFKLFVCVFPVSNVFVHFLS